MGGFPLLSMFLKFAEKNLEERKYLISKKPIDQQDTITTLVL